MKSRTPIGGLISILLFSSTLNFMYALDTITASQTIKVGDTVVSAGGSFELGFFSPGNSKNWYLGIWYKKISNGTVVWVANREVPVTNSSGVLKITNEGICIMLNGTNTIIWSSNSSRSARNPVAQLLDSGNLVIRDGDDTNQESFLWQSFDYPSDTLLPGMKTGKNFITGHEWFLSSWKSSDDPARGDFTAWLDPQGYPQAVLSKNSAVIYRAGPWNGIYFSGSPRTETNPIYKINFVFNQEELYYSYSLINTSVISRLVLTQNGVMQRLIWIDQTRGWFQYRSIPADNCDSYALCGAYGSCNIGNSNVCGCLNGFVPKASNYSGVADWSEGCVRRKPLDCANGDGFKKYSHVKLPDTRYSKFNESPHLEDCKIECLNNCSCMAYSVLNILRGSGCLLWFDDLIDIREFTDIGVDLYVRVASSELGEAGSDKEKRKRNIIILTSSMALLLLGVGLIYYIRNKKQEQGRRQEQQKSKNEGKIGQSSERAYPNESQEEDLELPFFDLATISNATNYFSFQNKLGEGGFGSVYKGLLKDGQHIAVKRLSKNSRQGDHEFKNEVMCIAKLQHRNLVKLLGYCIELEEKMLIYEFLPNKSLDSFIFDQIPSTLLDWPKRFHIINGVARGLLYLHQDSRLRIIHRDLKASNILLDGEMNPKISDFGLARIFGGNETEAKTNRVIGTYGYMSPEYAAKGLFSVKSDVFSFGVLVLEIVSGKRNREFDHPDHHLNLLGHAWRLSKEGKVSDLVDESIKDSYILSEVIRAVHVGLLCVQQYPEDRPNMSSVVLMLGGESALPQPQLPGFYTERNMRGAESSSSKRERSLSNEITITLLEPR